MWPFYVVYAAYALALIAAVIAVPLARRGARRTLWYGWAGVALVLPLMATSASATLLPAQSWPVWRLALGYLLILAVPTGAAMVVADRLGRRVPAPTLGRHVALVACAFVIGTVAAGVAAGPLFPHVSYLPAEQ